MNISERMRSLKIIPVITIEEAKDASPLGQALCVGGLPAAEITFRTAAAEESIKIIATEYPQMLVGAGSLTSVEQTQRALDAGASFLVTAGFNRKVTEYALARNVPIFPGVCTPTELMLLLEYELSVAKFFPAAQFGGLNTIKALSAPFPQMHFMPTGSINPGNVLEYLSFEKIIACGGSWMVKPELISSGQFEEIAALTRQASTLVNSLSKP